MNHPLSIWLGAIATLAVFSYLAKENIFYRLVQQGALGIFVGITVVLTWQRVLDPKWWSPMSSAFSGDGPWVGAFWLLALVPGSLWYFQLSKRWFWLSTLVSGLFVGVAAGYAFKNWMLLVMPQIGKSLKPLNPFAGPAGLTWPSFFASVNGLVFLVAFLTSLLYFFFSVKPDNRLLKRPMQVGRLMIMVALGAMFGATVMTRMAYFLERLQFLYETWLGSLLSG
jgi:hypothetical protein